MDEIVPKGFGGVRDVTSSKPKKFAYKDFML